MALPPVVHDDLGAIEQVIDRLEAPWLVGDAPSEEQFFSYRPLPMVELIRGLNVCREVLWTSSDETVGRRLLDVGCGIGRAMLFAHLTGWNVEGIDRYAPYVHAAERLVPEAVVGLCEAEDYEDYAEFDVVYSYRLCVDLGDQADLERLVVKQMRPGALFFAAGWDLSSGEHLGGGVWRV